MSTGIGLLFLLSISVYPSVMDGYQQCSVRPLQRFPNAQARFSVILSLRESSGGEECEAIKSTALMMVVAIDWVVSRLNNASLVPGVKYGYDLYDDCEIDRYSINSALDAMSYYFPSDLRTCSGNSSTYHLGFLGPTRSQTAEQVLKTVENYDIPVVSPTATSPDLRKSPNFFRTVPSDDDQVDVFINLIVKHNWNYVVAMYTNDNYGTYGINRIVERAKLRNICVKVIQGFKTTEKFTDESYREQIFGDILFHMDNVNKTLGVLYFGQRSVIKDLLQYMQVNLVLKPKLKDVRWIMSESVGSRVSVFNNAQDVTREAITVSMATLDILWSEVLQHKNVMVSSSDGVSDMVRNYGTISSDDGKDVIVSVIDATFALITSLKAAFDKKCMGYKVICDGFDDYYNSKKLETMNSTFVNYTALGPGIAPDIFYSTQRVVSFDTRGDLVPDSNSTMYNINMYINNKMTKIGHYTGGVLQTNSHFPTSYNSSICMKGCESCVETPDISFEFIEGDVYIIGFSSLHRAGDDPFGCGEFRNLTFDVLSVEAFLNSIMESRNQTGIRFGGIVFDDCYSSSRATRIVTDLFTGRLKVPSEERAIDPAKIVGVVGPFPSGVTVPVTHLFTSLELPSVSYASTSPDLDDKINFPYFFRTVPSDVDQANAMVKILKQMGWYSVGIVFVDNNYGSKGKDAFKRIASASGICIDAEIVVGTEDIRNANHKASENLRDAFLKGTSVFIYFGTEGRMVDVLSYIKTLFGETTKFVFIGSDDWADSRTIKDNFGTMIEGSLSFKIRNRATSTDFIKNLIKKTSSAAKAGYWYKQFFRHYNQCHFENDFVKDFPNKLCPDDISVKDTGGILADGRVSHIILAVKALTKGITKAKDVLCAGETSFPCLNYIRNITHVCGDIKDVTVADTNKISFKIFDKNGNGDVGFQLLQVVKDGTGFIYTEVGSYDNNNLVLNSDSVQAGLNRKVSAAECVSTVSPSPNLLQQAQEDNDDDLRISEIIIIGLIGFLCVILIIALVAMIYCCRKRVTDLNKRLDEMKSKLTVYNEIGTAAKKQKHKHSSKRHEDMAFDNPIFMNGGLVIPEQSAQHYLPLQESDQRISNHRYDGERLDLLNQTTPKTSVSASGQLLSGHSRPDLPPRNVIDRKVTSKSESEIHNSFPAIKPKMGNYSFNLTNQPKMGTALQLTPTDSLHSLHSQGSVFGSPRSPKASHANDENLPDIMPLPLPPEQNPPSTSLPSSPRSPYNVNNSLPSNNNIITTYPSKTLHSQLSNESSPHSKFTEDILRITGHLPRKPQVKRLKSFSSEETQKISRV